MAGRVDPIQKLVDGVLNLMRDTFETNMVNLGCRMSDVVDPNAPLFSATFAYSGRTKLTQLNKAGAMAVNQLVDAVEHFVKAGGGSVVVTNLQFIKLPAGKTFGYIVACRVFRNVPVVQINEQLDVV